MPHFYNNHFIIYNFRYFEAVESCNFSMLHMTGRISIKVVEAVTPKAIDKESTMIHISYLQYSKKLFQNEELNKPPIFPLNGKLRVF